MTLPSQGLPISLNQIHVEAGGTSGTIATINDPDIRALISKADGAQMSFSEWYGVSKPSANLLNTTMTIGNSSFDSASGTWSWNWGETTFNGWWLINDNEGWLGSGNLYGYDGTAGGDYYADQAWGPGGGAPVSGEEIFIWTQNPNTMGSMASTSVSGRTITYLYRSTNNVLYLGLNGTGTFSFTSLIVNGNTFTSATAGSGISYGNRYYVWNSADGVSASTFPTSGSINVRIT